MLKQLMVISVCCMAVMSCKPKPMWVTDAYENAPPSYKQGWKDGCESGYAAYGNQYYRAFYTFKQDVSMINDREYAKAWDDSFQYCRSYINTYLRTGLYFSGGRAEYDSGVFGTQDLRGDSLFQGKSGVLGFPTKAAALPEPFDGLDTPGWNYNHDWLNRSDAEATDWLGRTKKYQ